MTANATRLRPRQSLFVAAAGAGALARGAASVVVGVPFRDTDFPFWVISGVPFALASLVALVRVSIEIGTDEVVVRNVLRTYHVPWTRIAKIDRTDWWPSPMTLIFLYSIIRVEQSDGRRVYVAAAFEDCDGPVSTALGIAARQPGAIACSL